MSSLDDSGSMVPDGAGFRRSLMTRGGVIVLLTLLVYSSMWRAGFVWDDKNVQISGELVEREEAIEHFRRAADIDPGFPDAHVNLGVALATQGRMDEAITHFRRALQIKPDLVAAHINLANALLAQGNVDAAIDRYRLALEHTPDHAQAHFSLGAALGRAGRIDERSNTFARCFASNPIWPPRALLDKLSK